MFALMFDPWFKSSKVAKNYVGCGLVFVLLLSMMLM
jgi:hypothetical protein